MFLAMLTSRFQKLALHRLYVRRKTFRYLLRTLLVCLGFEFLNLLHLPDLLQLLLGRLFILSDIAIELLIFVNSRACARRLRQQEQVLLVQYSSIGSTVARFISASMIPLTGPVV